MEVEDDDAELKKALLMSVGKDAAAAAEGGGAAGGGAAGEKVPVTDKVNPEILEQLCDMVGAVPCPPRPLRAAGRRRVMRRAAAAGLPARAGRQGHLAGGRRARRGRQLARRQPPPPPFPDSTKAVPTSQSPSPPHTPRA